MRTRFKNDKLHEVVDLLNEAAKEKKEELYGLIGEKYGQIAEAIQEKAENGLHAVESAKKQLFKALQDEEEKIFERAKEVDKQAHENPWAFVGAVAFVSFLFGVRFGRKASAPRVRQPAIPQDNNGDEK
ncbi:MAG TPA: hypothetical protein VL688_10120 [Verrucomicrobiae bacterium]|nr:hypothetical protein [Verrucomicrobiae bacterium]